MTKTQTAKIAALRDAAEMHDDTKMVAICDAALAGDTAALAKCGIVVKATKAAQSASDRKGQRPSAWAAPARTESLDLEDLGHPNRTR